MGQSQAITYPNQCEFQVKKSPANNNEQFIIRNLKAERAANVDLCKYPSALRLWYYFTSWKEGQTFALSPAAVELAMGISRSSYYRALKLLEEHGYVYMLTKNKIEFYDSPQLNPYFSIESLSNYTASLTVESQ